MANAVSVAEHTIFFMLYLAKNIKNVIDSDNVTMTSLMTKREATILGSELQAKTLFIIGLGATGIEVAKSQIIWHAYYRHYQGPFFKKTRY